MAAGVSSEQKAPAQVDADSLAAERAERCRQLGKKNGKCAKIVQLTGAARDSTMGRLLSDGGWRPTSGLEEAVEEWSDACVVVVRDAAMSAVAKHSQKERKGWRPDYGYIRDVPVGREGKKGDVSGARTQWEVPSASKTAKGLDAILGPLRERLGVRVVARVGLLSKPEGPRQVCHYDFHQQTCRTWMDRCRGRALRVTRPWTCLVSLENGGKLNIFDSGRWVQVHLQEGDVVVFRSDVWHGGASYQSAHWRLHEYWEPIAAETEDLSFRRDDEGNLTLHELESEKTWKLGETTGDPGYFYAGPTYTMKDLLARPHHVLS